MRRWACAVMGAAAMLGGVRGATAQTAAKPGLAEQPPMGWNSWDAYGLTITEEQFRANAAVLAARLKPFGWTVAVIDEGWFLTHPEGDAEKAKSAYVVDANGRYIPVATRFPSAMVQGKNTGFATLGAYVHSLGLQFGIHIVRGIPRQSVAKDLPVEGSAYKASEVADTTDACPWDATNWGVRDTAAGQAWYDALLRQYAAWGVDYLKVDCISDHPYKGSEIRMIHRAIEKTGRPMVLSLSPGPTSAGFVTELMANAQMWRISDDVWDVWSTTEGFPRSVRDQFELAAGWVPFAHAGSWPDADMLPLGSLRPNPGYGPARETRLTHEEQRTMMTLWAIARSPLIVGANLTQMDAWTEGLLRNREVLAINQNGRNQRQVSREQNSVAWTSENDDGSKTLALFNLGDAPARVQHSYAFYGFPLPEYGGTEVWTGTERRRSAGVDETIAPHGCVLLRLR